MGDSSIYLKVQSRKALLFEGQVSALTSYNDRGTFDVLLNHANFISLVKKKLIIHQHQQEDQQILFDFGILKVYQNTAYIYIVS